MSHEERYGTRDQSYSAWHRRNSTKRYVGIENAQNLSMIDVDASLYVEYDEEGKEPVALIETAQDIGQEFKTGTITRNLAKRCDPPLYAYVVLYTLSDYPNPADPSWPDIELFRVRRLWPNPSRDWIACSPEEWCKNLLKIRRVSARELDLREQKKKTLPGLAPDSAIECAN